MTGSGTSWTFTDPALKGLLSRASASTISNMVFRAYAYANNEDNLTVTGYNAQTGALSLSGAFSPPSSGSSFTLYNDADLVNSSTYAIEGNQIIAAVQPGQATVSVSTSPWAFRATNQSNLTIQGFDVSGYGDGDGRAIYVYGGQNEQILNNTLSNIATHANYGFGAINVYGADNLTVSGNSVANITYGAGITDSAGTNTVVTNNTIDSPGWTGIVAFDDVNTSISGNRISNTYGVHANGIIAFSINTTSTQQSQNVSITNNQIENGGGGIAIEGDPSLPGPSATPDNFTIAYNVVTGQPYGVADWGNTNTANIYGNILLTTGGSAALRLKNTSENVSIYDNILEAYPYIDPANPPAADTLSNNVALTTNFLPGGVVGFGTNNTVDAALGSVLQQALGSPGVLPSSIGSILTPAQPGQIGLDWTTGSLT